VIQLFVRTGQPGVAPEREVIDRYEINGYIAKVEATEDKLYSMVKSGIRQNYYMNTSTVLSDLLIALIAASRSRAGMAQILNYTTAALQSTATGERGELVDINLALMVGDETFAGTWDTPQAREVRDRLMAGTTQSLSPDGDYYAIDGTDFLIRIAPTPANVELFMVGRGVIAPPAMIIALLHKFSRALAGLYLHAEDVVLETT
jgi:hypothetical protein